MRAGSLSRLNDQLTTTSMSHANRPTRRLLQAFGLELSFIPCRYRRTSGSSQPRVMASESDGVSDITPHSVGQLGLSSKSGPIRRILCVPSTAYLNKGRNKYLVNDGSELRCTNRKRIYPLGMSLTGRGRIPIMMRNCTTDGDILQSLLRRKTNGYLF